MGWLWPDRQDSNDPTKNLDPKLREFLIQEEPASYKPGEHHPVVQEALDRLNPPPPPPNKKPTPEPEETSTTSNPDNKKNKPKVPPQSLFPDGRYAHLWKTYTPNYESMPTTSHDKMARVVEIHKERKAQLARAALENCADEHTALNTCFSTGGIRARMTMCKRENNVFSRCYDMQTKFLRALGYASVLDQDRERAERVQMHADTLYHRMLTYEDAVKRANKDGLPEPTYESLFDNAESKRASDFPADPQGRHSKILPRSLLRLKKPLAEMTPMEQEIEVRALVGEMKVLAAYNEKIEDAFLEIHLTRLRQNEKLSRWIGEWAAEKILPTKERN